ncbi:septum formation family protein [Micromonospora sp. R77]|uniref:septum formation family protein n=1 Tax=Micromonospora sp. R77 TaxID=2925836 RepID=UPI001F60B85C|nr:septum formation family protein [Micromonospora sp. R77]MCI4062294.1 septum formation family protein [Micromonospora sp. R77]
MRRWCAAAAAALITAVLAGCGTPAGTDGDLTDDWRPVGQVTQFAPKAGDCHLSAEPTSYLTGYQPVDCTRTHLVETVHLGTFTGAVAARATPPPLGSAAMRPAFAECDARTTAFVGGDWRGARLTFQVVPPSPAGWAGGSRWFRCDLFELSTIEGGTRRSRPNDYPVQRSGTLRDALKGPSKLAYGCLTEDEWASFQQTTCQQGHQYEYVGTWTAPDGQYPDAAAREDGIHANCRTVVARYAKVPVDGQLRYRTGTSYRLPTVEAWARGDRGVRCFFWSGGKKLTGSIRGGGTKALPVN